MLLLFAIPSYQSLFTRRGGTAKKVIVMGVIYRCTRARNTRNERLPLSVFPYAGRPLWFKKTISPFAIGNRRSEWNTRCYPSQRKVMIVPVATTISSLPSRSTSYNNALSKRSIVRMRLLIRNNSSPSKWRETTKTKTKTKTCYWSPRMQMQTANLLVSNTIRRRRLSKQNRTTAQSSENTIPLSFLPLCPSITSMKWFAVVAIISLSPSLEFRSDQILNASMVKKFIWFLSYPLMSTISGLEGTPAPRLALQMRLISWWHFDDFDSVVASTPLWRNVIVSSRGFMWTQASFCCSTHKTISSGVLALRFRNLLDSLSFVFAPETNSWETQQSTNKTTSTNVGLLLFEFTIFLLINFLFFCCSVVPSPYSKIIFGGLLYITIHENHRDF